MSQASGSHLTLPLRPRGILTSMGCVAAFWLYSYLAAYINSVKSLRNCAVLCSSLMNTWLSRLLFGSLNLPTITEKAC